MWFFRKKEDLPKWDHLHKTLTKSFSHIKHDVSLINGRLLESFESHKAHKKDILILHRRLSRIESLVENLILEYSKSKKEKQLVRLPPEESVQENVDTKLQNLTNLQKSILVNLSIIRDESSKEWVSMRDLAQEMYPNKKYSKIKSLISAYTDLLVDLGLMKKERKGKETLLSLTDKSSRVIKKSKTNKKVENNNN
ncbi:MAG TPA: hypothetical protein VJH20_00330 [Candidatus Nanoarchaeia archaeon]|nr:hypothetical protein [Candidatus Nanoarchaeia archaeon]